MISTYIEQLEDAAAAAGVSLDVAAKAEGYAGSTIWRWRNAQMAVGEATAQKLARRIARMRKAEPEQDTAA